MNGRPNRQSSAKRLLEIGDEIVRIFQADGHAKQIIGNVISRMHHRGGMLDEAFRTAKAAGVDEEANSGRGVDRTRPASPDAKRQHSAKIAHLRGSNRVAGVRWQAWVQDLDHLRMTLEGVGDGKRVRRMDSHARAEGSKPTVDEPRAERRCDGAE